jgi:hypothetical protein
MWRNMMRSTKNKKASVLHYSTSRKPARCTGKLLKIKFKLILISFTSFVEEQDLATNQFVARLLQPLRGNL